MKNRNAAAFLSICLAALVSMRSLPGRMYKAVKNDDNRWWERKGHRNKQSNGPGLNLTGIYRIPGRNRRAL